MRAIAYFCFWVMALQSVLLGILGLHRGGTEGMGIGAAQCKAHTRHGEYAGGMHICIIFAAFAFVGPA